MSHMLNHLVTSGALDLIGGVENYSMYTTLESLDNQANKLASAQSKPFKSGKVIFLEPTIDYYKFWESVYAFANNQQNFSALTNLNIHHNIPSHITSLVSIIREVINSNQQVPPDNLKHYSPQVSSAIDTYYTGIWNSIRGQILSNSFKLKQDKIKSLISLQYKENIRIVGRLLRKHDSLRVFRLVININQQGNMHGCDIALADESATQVYRQFINHLRHITLGQALYIQSRLQRTITGQCYANIFIYAKPDAQINLNIDLQEFRHYYETGLTQLLTDVSSLNYSSLELGAFSNQVYNFEQWKVFFKSVLYPLNYYYYESKKIKPSFTATLL